MTTPAAAGTVRRSSFRDRLVATWYAPRLTALALVLLPLSWLFRAIAALRRSLYRAGVLRVTRVGVPVVVVGNITAGGTGKTPLVIAIVEALRASGRRPGIVSRGHGRDEGHEREVRPDDDPADVGDEPLLLAASGAPVWVGRDRVAATRALRAAHGDCDVIVSDDGLQHYALHRDVEIAVVDASRGFGNGRMLPSGPLREPTSRLRDVDAVVQLVAQRQDVRPVDARRVFTMTHEPVGWRNLVEPGRRFDAASASPESTHAVAGIGNPQRFFDLLARMGIDAVPHAFDDHHPFTGRDLAFPDAQAILMTAKDAVKCERFADARFFALDIRAVPDPALVRDVLERLDGRQAARDPRLSGDQGTAGL